MILTVLGRAEDTGCSKKAPNPATQTNNKTTMRSLRLGVASALAYPVQGPGLDPNTGTKGGGGGIGETCNF